MGSQVMTLKETAAYLRVSEQTIRNWVNSGKLPCFKVAGAVRFSKDEIDKLLKQTEA